MPDYSIIFPPRPPLAIAEFDTGFAEKRDDGLFAVCGQLLRNHGDCVWEQKVRDLPGAVEALKGHKRPRRSPDAAVEGGPS